MRMAILNGKVLVGDASEYYKPLSAFMSWNKTRKCLEAPASADVLASLRKLVPLTPGVGAAYYALHDKQGRIDRERVNEHPVPFMEIPVRANLYTHQVRGINMCLMAFEVI